MLKLELELELKSIFKRIIGKETNQEIEDFIKKKYRNWKVFLSSSTNFYKTFYKSI